jgi:uncharacterized membrane protein YfcA
MINVVVGSGTLVTFPTLLLFGYPPLVANVSNNIGLVGGGITGTFGYRRELVGRRWELRRLLPASLLGGITGAVLLLILPADAFRTIVPVLIAVGLAMVVWGPALQRRAARARDAARGRGAASSGDAARGCEAASSGDAARGCEAAPSGDAARARDAALGGDDASSGDGGADDGRLPGLSRPRLAAVLAGIYLLGIYGGYFGAAQGVLIVGLMSVLTSEGLQAITGLKNLLATAVNAIAAVTFLIVSPESVDWTVVLLIAIGATAGGVVGARVGRRLPPWLMRALIVVVGLAAIVRMLFFA